MTSQNSADTPASNSDNESSDEPETAFVRLLGSQGRARMLDGFIRHADTSLTASDLVDLAGVSPSTISRHIDLFIELGLVEEAGKTGGATLYRTNTESELLRTLAKAQQQLRAKLSGEPAAVWPGNQEDPEGGSEDTHTTTSQHGVIAKQLPVLFASDDADARKEAAKKLQRVILQNPQAGANAVPALVELLEDEDDDVARAATLSIQTIIDYDSELVDDDDIQKVIDLFVDSLDGSETDSTQLGQPSTGRYRRSDAASRHPSQTNDSDAEANHDGPKSSN